MPRFEHKGLSIHYEDSGEGEQAILFSHGLLFSTRLFDHQVAALKPHYRCIAYDHRGQGQSDLRANQPLDMDSLSEDAAALIEHLGIGPCHFVGLSMGGFVGQRLAARRPELIQSLTLMATSAQAEPQENVPRYKKLNLVTRFLGIWVVAGRVQKIMFSHSFLNNPDRRQDKAYWRRQLMANKRSIHRAVRGVIERPDTSAELSAIKKPTLIMVGEEDVATKPGKAEALHQGIASSTLIRVPAAGHSIAVEQPERVNQEILSFLGSLTASAKEGA